MTDGVKYSDVRGQVGGKGTERNETILFDLIFYLTH
jgi:hypothetical protein